MQIIENYVLRFPIETGHHSTSKIAQRATSMGIGGCEERMISFAPAGICMLHAVLVSGLRGS